MRSTRLLTVGLVLTIFATAGAAHPIASPILGVVKVGIAPSAISVDEQTRRAFVVNHGPPYTISVMDTQTGKVLRTVVASSARLDSSDRPVAMDVLHNRVLTLNSGSDSASLLDATSGRLLRTVSLGFAPQYIAVDALHGRAFIPNNNEDANDAVIEVLDTVRMRTVGALRLRGDAIVADERAGHIFVRTFRGVDMVDAATHRLLATTSVIGTPVAVDSVAHRVFVLKANPLYTDDFRLSVLDSRTAALVRSISLPLQAAFSPIVDSRRGRAFLAVGRAIDVFDTVTGRLLRTIAATTGPSRFAGSPLAVDDRTGGVYAVWSPLDQYGNPTNVAYLRVFDPSSGALKVALQIGPSPLAIAIDSRTRRVFILHAAPGGNTQPSPGRRGTVTVLDTPRL